MPFMVRIDKVGHIRDWVAEEGVVGVDIVAAVQIEVAHPLSEKLQMALVRLEDLLQDSTLVEQIGQACHIGRVEKVNLQEVFVADMIAEVWNAFDETDVCDKDGFGICRVSSVGDCQSMVDGEPESCDILVDRDAIERAGVFDVKIRECAMNV
jgi:hypothetical protein